MNTENENNFEQYWLEHRQQLLNQNQEYRETLESYKMHSGADWLLFALPVVAALLVFDWHPFANELLCWVVSALVAIVCFALCVAVKSYLSNTRPLSEIEAEIKEQARKDYESNE
ncbi:MAG: hypothetical protein K6C10_05330 [Prevotella sp.]|nr:hypothetical protein [Prevotella sp.]